MGDRRSFEKRFQFLLAGFPLSRVQYIYHSQGLQSDFHPLLGQLRRVGLKFSCAFINPNCCPFLPLVLCCRGGYVLFACPLESTRAADFNFRLCLAGVTFPGDLFNPFYTILKDLILPSNIRGSPVISSILL